MATAVQGSVAVREIDFNKLDEQLREAATFDRVIVVGGDGTFSTVLAAASGAGSPLSKTPIGVLPIGTANDLAREVGLFDLCRFRRYEELPRLFEMLPQRALSVWEAVADRVAYPFCNYVSLGFEGAVVSDFHAWRATSKIQHRLVNRVIYSWFGLRNITRMLRGARIEHDNTNVDIPSSRGIVVSNIQSHMGVGIIARESDPFDEMIECVRASSPCDYLRMIGAKLHLLPSLRSLYRGKRFLINNLAPRTPMQIDGEPGPEINGGVVFIRHRGFAQVLVNF